MSQVILSSVEFGSVCVHIHAYTFSYTHPGRHKNNKGVGIIDGMNP